MLHAVYDGLADAGSLEWQQQGGGPLVLERRGVCGAGGRTRGGKRAENGQRWWSYLLAWLMVMLVVMRPCGSGS